MALKASKKRAESEQKASRKLARENSPEKTRPPEARARVIIFYCNFSHEHKTIASASASAGAPEPQSGASPNGGAITRAPCERLGCGRWARAGTSWSGKNLPHKTNEASRAGERASWRAGGRRRSAGSAASNHANSAVAPAAAQKSEAPSGQVGRAFQLRRPTLICIADTERRRGFAQELNE